MKLIWLTAELPFPPNTGGRIVMYKRIKYLSRNNDIYLFSIIDRNEEEKYISDLQKYCKDVKLYSREGKLLRNMLGLLFAPYVCESRWYTKMKNDIEENFYSTHPDYVIVDFPQMLGNLSDEILRSRKVILNQHNTEYVTLRNLSNLFDNPFKRVIYWLESYRLERLEKKNYKRGVIKLFTFVSIEDKVFFEKKYNLTNTYLLPIGTEICPLEKRGNGEFVISYIGKMEYSANAEAALWFAYNVFIKLRREIDNISFYIVGKNPPKKVSRLEEVNSSIIVTGTVDSVDEYFEKSDIVVIPLFHGGGVKVKLLEALGHKKLVITTSKGIEGTIFKNRKELLVAETSEQFENIIKDVISHQESYEIIREQGFNCVKENYTWSAIINNYESILRIMLE